MSSDYSSEEENNVSESSGEESDDSSFLENVTKEVEQLKPYLYEPMCSTLSKSCNNQGSNIEVDVVAQPSRVGVLNWCMCKNCQKESREIDCLCCQEDDAVDELKLDGNGFFFSVCIYYKNLKSGCIAFFQFSFIFYLGKICVNMNPEFKMLCLNKAVLQNVLVSLHETRGDLIEKEITNRLVLLYVYLHAI